MNEHETPLDGLIDAYVRGVLNDRDQARLEQAMLDDPALFERVQQTELLRRGLRDSVLTETSRPAWSWPARLLSGALSLALIGLLGWNMALNQKMTELRAPQGGIPVITLHNKRSLLAPVSLAQPTSSGGPVLIELDVSAANSELFDLRIDSAKGSQQLSNLRRDNRGYLTVLISDLQLPLVFRISIADSDEIQIFEISSTADED